MVAFECFGSVVYIVRVVAFLRLVGLGFHTLWILGFRVLIFGFELEVGGLLLWCYCLTWDCVWVCLLGLNVWGFDCVELLHYSFSHFGLVIWGTYVGHLI